MRTIINKGLEKPVSQVEPLAPIPVTVITGFLGSGKTTLLNRILTENHGMRIAVIENEFGEVGIDDALVLSSEEEIFEKRLDWTRKTIKDAAFVESKFYEENRK